MERLPQLILFVAPFLMIFASTEALIKSVYVFGDSLFDAGNNRLDKNCSLQANFPPYGSTFFKHPTGRFSNGRTVVDFIAQYMGIEFQKPFREVYQELTKDRRKGIPANGINFASGGSGVLTQTNKDIGVTPIQVQLQQVQSLIDQNHIQKKLLANSLFFLESGSNDIFNYFITHKKQNLVVKDYVNAMLKEVDSFLDKIYKLGARRIVVFSVGPMGCVPARAILGHTRINECADVVNNMVKAFNDGLEGLVKGTSKKYPNAIAVFGAVYDNAQSFRANPKLHGFTNVNDACCGNGPLNGMLQCGLQGYKKCPNPNEFFFWDYFHPSERTYELLSKLLWDGGNNHIRPMNLKKLATITLPSP